MNRFEDITLRKDIIRINGGRCSRGIIALCNLYADIHATVFGKTFKDMRTSCGKETKAIRFGQAENSGYRSRGISTATGKEETFERRETQIVMEGDSR